MKNFTIGKGGDSVSVSGEFPGEVRLVVGDCYYDRSDVTLESHEVDHLIGGLDRLNGDLHDSSLLDLIEELVKIGLRNCFFNMVGEKKKPFVNDDLDRLGHASAVVARFRSRSANWTEEEPF